METDDLVKRWPDLTGSVLHVSTEICTYYDGACSGLATIAGQPGHWFLLEDDDWGDDKRDRLFALYCLTRPQIAAINRGEAGPLELPDEQLVGWATGLGAYWSQPASQDPHDPQPDDLNP